MIGGNWTGVIQPELLLVGAKGLICIAISHTTWAKLIGSYLSGGKGRFDEELSSTTHSIDGVTGINP